MQDRMQTDEIIPDAESFRIWIVAVLERLKISAHRLAQLSNAPVNSVHKFVNREQHDLRLNTASRLVAGAAEYAKSQKVELPALNQPDQVKVSPEEDGALA